MIREYKSFVCFKFDIYIDFRFFTLREMSLLFLLFFSFDVYYSVRIVLQNGGVQEAPVLKVRINPKYNRKNKEHDLAIFSAMFLILSPCKYIILCISLCIA